MDVKKAFFILVSFVLILHIHDYRYHNDNTNEVDFDKISLLEPANLNHTKQPALPEIDVEQMHCLAKNIYFEARGETTQGKVGVANVVMNRVEHWHYPNTICGVVYQAKLSQWWLDHNGREVPVRNMCQFSWYCDGKSDELVLTDSNGVVIKAHLEAWEESIEIAKMAITGHLFDITNGATHYYNPELANPLWAVHYEETATIDSHCFHKM